MRRRLIILCSVAAAVALLLSGTTKSQETPIPATEDEFLKRLQEVAGKLDKIEDMSAEFEQQKHTPLLKKPMVSKGQVWVKGRRTLWHTLKPYETWVQVDSDTLRLYEPRSKTVEEYSLEKHIAELAASPIPRLDALRGRFTFQPETSGNERGLLGVRLLPKDESVSRYVRSVVVWIDTDTGLARKTEWVDADEERTLLEFSRVKINGGLKDEQVTIPLPSDVKVVRPQGAR